MKVLLLDKNCTPIRGSEEAAGLDLKSASENTQIFPGETKKIHTGICVEIPTGQVGLVYPRSGLGTKHNIRLANTVGIIDSDYRGEILVFLHNSGDQKVTINKYDKFAQLVVTNIWLGNPEIVEKLTPSKRGGNGFGSTGT